MPSKVTMKCGTCGSGADVQYAPWPGQIPGASTAGRFICADCLYLEDHPDATRDAAGMEGPIGLAAFYSARMA